MVRRSPAFRLLWFGQGVSDLGSAVGSVAFPLIGVLALHTSVWQTSLVAACGYLPQGLLALPAGPLVERRRKRVVMITSDLVRAGALASLALAGWLAVLTFTQLVAVTLVVGLADLTFSLADQAHLPALVPADDLAAATSVQASTTWVSSTAGPALAGWLTSVAGPVRTVLVDAASFLASAVAVARIREPEPPPPQVTGDVRERVFDGLRYVRAHRPLHRLLWAGALLSWSVLLVSPVEVLFVLRTLHASPTQYGIVFAAPCAGGFLGSLVARRIVSRLGTARALFWSGLLRGPWLVALPLAQPGIGGVVFVGVCWAGLLSAAAVYNVTQAVYRQTVTPVHLRSRVAAAFKCVIGAGKPLAPLFGGLLASVVGLRWTLLVGGLVLTAAPLLLDRHVDAPAPARADELAATPG